VGARTRDVARWCFLHVLLLVAIVTVLIRVIVAPSSGLEDIATMVRQTETATGHPSSNAAAVDGL
jgi:hypothetical protein